MNNSKINSEIAAHNVATILTQVSITETDKEQIPISVNASIPGEISKFSKQYSYYYNEFYKAALKHFTEVLNDDVI